MNIHGDEDWQENINRALSLITEISGLDFGDEDDDHELFDAINNLIEILQVRAK